MRALSLGILAIALAVVATPAWSLDVDVAPGPTVFKTFDWEAGTVYWGEAGTYTRGSDAVWRDAQGDPALGTKLFSSPPPNRMNDQEDAWGAFVVTQMFPGVPGTLGASQPWVYQGSSMPSWNSSSTQSLFGFYYGGRDAEVTIKKTQTGNEPDFDPFAFDVMTDDMKFDAYLLDGPPPPVPPENWKPSEVTRNASGGFDEWSIAGAANVLSGNVVDLVFVGGPVGGHPGSAGYTDLYLDVTSGTWDEWDTDYFGPGRDGHMHWVLGPISNDWLISEDSARVLPEPTTLCLLAGGALVALLRRRRS